MSNATIVARSLLSGIVVLTVLLGFVSSPATADSRHGGFKKPLVIGHRGGATGYLPDHTLENYALGIELGADFIEPDLVVTRDGHLIARHEPNIKTTTDVASHPEFASRAGAPPSSMAPRTRAGSRPTSRSPRSRRCGRCSPSPSGPQQFNGRFQIPTLEEVIALAKRKSEEKDRTIGIYPETKHPTYHKSIGLPIEGPLVRILRAAGWNHRDAPVFIQSFEQSNLKELRRMTRDPPGPARRRQRREPRRQPRLHRAVRSSVRLDGVRRPGASRPHLRLLRRPTPGCARSPPMPTASARGSATSSAPPRWI